MCPNWCDTGDDAMAPGVDLGGMGQGKWEYKGDTTLGDMADFALDCAADDCEDYDNFQSGRYCHQEAYDRGFTNEMGGEHPGPQG